MDLSAGAVALLAVAGFLAGAINAAAGGGSLITFPALIPVGYPPLLANVTNNIAVVPGYVTGVWGYRERLRGQGRRVAPAAAGGARGGSRGGRGGARRRAGGVARAGGARACARGGGGSLRGRRLAP